MKSKRLIIITAILLMALSVQFESTANAGSYVGGRRESSVTLSRTQRPPASSQKLPASYRPTSNRPSAYNSAYGPHRGWQQTQPMTTRQQTRPTTTSRLGPTHGRRLTPAQSRELIKSSGFRRCGIDISCTTRIVSDRPMPTSTLSLGDMLAREQIRDAISIGRLSPFAQTPAPSEMRTPPTEDLGDALARRAILQFDESMLGF